MKQLIVIFIICILSSCSQQPEAYDSHRNPINLNDYRGKWIIVNYWADWCRPCLAEMPILNAFYQAHQKNIMVLGVNFDGKDDQELNHLALKQHIEYPLLAYLNNTQLEEQDFSVLPISFVFNPKGELTQILRGPQTEASLQNATHPQPR